jgi:hypothetical protein
MSKKKFDRSAIMRRAHELRRTRALTLSDAMRLVWAEAKGSHMPALAGEEAQQGGLKAALAAIRARPPRGPRKGLHRAFAS